MLFNGEQGRVSNGCYLTVNKDEFIMDAATEPIRADSFYVFTEEELTRQSLEMSSHLKIIFQ